MERLLIFTKHHFRLLWVVIEWVNGFIISLLYKSKLKHILPGVFDEFMLRPYLFRNILMSDITLLNELLRSQSITDREYFKPHKFDIISLRRQLDNPSLLMMGVFYNEKIIGYFFLRLFANKRCFVGRLIDKDYRGQGIGEVMNSIMYETSWRMGFRCMSTISRNNHQVMKAHARNPNMIVLKELHSDYLLLEFISNC